MAIIKRLSTLSLGNCGQRLNIKSSAVDLPLSSEVFRQKFPVNYAGEVNFKTILSVSDLDKVFGRNWHIFDFPRSNTRKRIIGIVNLHYRKKTMTKFPINDSRIVEVQENVDSFWLRIKFQAVKENTQLQEILCTAEDSHIAAH